MVVVIKNNTLRIRLTELKHFDKFRTKDVGKKGRLQIILGMLKPPNPRLWVTQSIRMNLMDYKNAQDALNELNKLDDKYMITHYLDAKYLIADWFNKR